MTETLYAAMKRSRNDYTVAAFKQIATSDELFGVIPFVPKQGEGFDYTREKSLGSFGFVADGHSSVTASEGEDEIVRVHKREAVADFYVRNFAQENMGDRVDPLERQTMMKFKAAGRTLAQKIITGGNITGITLSENISGTGPGIDALVSASAYFDSNRQGAGAIKYTHTGTLWQFRAPGDRDYGPAVAAATDGNYTLTSDNPSKSITVTLDVSDATANKEILVTFSSSTNEFDGLANLIPSGQIRTSTGTDGDAVSFPILDELMDSLKVMDNPAFIMNSALRRKVLALLRGAGGIDPVQIMDGTFTVPSYNGIPILKNDWIPSTESKGSGTTLSSIYLASLSAEQGFWMGALGGQTFNVDADPRDATVMGFRLYDLGQSQAGASSRGRRLAFFGAPALGSDLAAARASELVTA
jgi:hypothetical protein